MWTVRHDRPARRPRRIAVSNSSRRRIRFPAASTGMPRLSAQACPALGPARGEDRATRSGAHPKPEAVGLGTPTVVRLKGALTHSRLQESPGIWGVAGHHRKPALRSIHAGMRQRPPTTRLSYGTWPRTAGSNRAEELTINPVPLSWTANGLPVDGQAITSTAMPSPRKCQAIRRASAGVPQRAWVQRLEDLARTC